MKINRNKGMKYFRLVCYNSEVKINKQVKCTKNKKKRRYKLHYTLNKYQSKKHLLTILQSRKAIY